MADFDDVKRAYKRADNKSASRDRQRQARELMRRFAWVGAVLIAVTLALGWISLRISPLVGALAFIGLAGLSYAMAEHDDSISLTFALSAVAIGVLIAEFVAPGWLVEPIAEFLLGWGPAEWFAGWDPVTFAVLTGVTIVGWWIIDIRLISRSGVKAETVAKRLSTRIQNLVEEWLSVGRVAVMLLIGIGLLVLNQLGMLSGEFVSIVGEVPQLAANVFTILLGYLALGGDVPWLNGIPFLEEVGATGFVIVAAIVLVIAVGVEYAD